MTTRCKFCNNAILEFQSKLMDHGHVYHAKCLDQAKASAKENEGELMQRRQALENEREEAAKRAQEEFEKQPKYLGTVEVRGVGFIVDPRTGKRRMPVNGQVGEMAHDVH
jgi:uncharacterized protein YlxW (UPF0749 family)